MTKDDIIKLAREAGMPMVWISNSGVLTWTELIAFAALVAKHEREACETAVEDMARKYQKAHEVSAENVADACAYAIRARGEKA